MSWLVTTDNDQFSAKSLEDLKKKARTGELSPGDLVQPPGARDWLYAFELPEMSACFPPNSTESDLEAKGFPIRKLLGLILFVSGIALIGGAYHYYKIIPKSSDLQLLGEKGMTQEDGLVTAEKASLYASPEGKKRIGYVTKNKVLKILGKKYGFYKVQFDSLNEIDVISDFDNYEGWISVKEIVPAYLFAKDKIKKEFDARYNTHRYIDIHQESWKNLDYPTTLFNFQLQNGSKFDLDQFDVKAVLKSNENKTIKDLNFNIKGLIKRDDTAKIGSLMPTEGSAEKIEYMTYSEFKRREKSNPNIVERWADGLLVELPQKFSKATFMVRHAKVKTEDK